LAEAVRNSFTLGETMKKIYASVWVLVCLFAVTANAQDSTSAPAQKNIAFEIKIVDTDARTLEAMEEIARDQNRLNQLITEGKAKLVAGTKVVALFNERTSMRIGQRVPIQTATLPTFQAPGSNPANNQTPQPAVGVPQVAHGVPQIQYESTGFTLEFEPRVKRDGTIDLVFKIELTIVSTDTGRLTPTFITRNLMSSIKIKQQQPPIILDMFQNEFLSLPSAQPNPANPLRGNFFILLSARVID
jgi:type II secretory pathway component GspD/PulD (secretin)